MATKATLLQEASRSRCDVLPQWLSLVWALIRPVLEYAASHGMIPHLITPMNRIELLQRRSARFIFND